MKIISPKIHAVLDYLTVIFFAVSPSLFPLSAILMKMCYGLSIIHLLLTLTTQNFGGFVKVIPLRIHGLVEFVIALLFGIIALANFTGYNEDQVYFAALSVVFLLVFSLTDFKGTFRSHPEDSKRLF
jgi:hypothetical protein